MKVQYGCGFSAPPDWINFDASPTLRFEKLPIVGRLYQKNAERFPEKVRYGNIVHGLPISENHCDFVYSSHVLEHLALDDFRKALDNTGKILKRGGVFRFVVPDFEYSVKLYVESDSNIPSIDFHMETLLGTQERPRTMLSFIREYLGNSRHLWMWDYKSIRSELENLGFKDIRRAYYADSKYSVFQIVEEHHRWSNALGVECKKI